jgi:peptidase E
MASAAQPLFLLADSQLLFWRSDGALWLEQARRQLRPPTPDRPQTAAYIGASNGDQPIFFELFRSAMAGIALDDCRHIHAQPSADERAYLAQADLILLAGGDPHLGWTALQASGLPALLQACYQRGATLLGISAGAMQLGQLAWPEHNPSAPAGIATLGLTPYVVSAHDEPAWSSLRQIIASDGQQRRGLGIRTGGGAIAYPDGRLAAVRQPLDLFSIDAGRIQQRSLAPS